MNVLVTYFSQSGNTEKIAAAIFDQASQSHDATLKKLEEITPEKAAGYDFIFIGSPLHAGSLSVSVKECLTALKPSPNQKLAAFITHMAPAYPEQDMETFTDPVKAACQENKIAYMGCFDCQGFLSETLHDAVQKKLGLDDYAWADMVKAMTGRPNQDDENLAKAFAKKLLA